jgi:tetratricopeptide (TPR) repeat protein
MADLYSTFQLAGLRGRIALHKTEYVVLLRREGLMSLQELMEVTTKSPVYYERHLQGRFYAQSWLLTHYLVAGDNAVLRSRFPSYTARLKDGEDPLEALTKTLGVTPVVLENALQSYLMRPTLHNIEFSLKQEVRPPNSASARPMSQAEAAIRLGNQLLRVRQFDSAEQYMEFARRLAPTNAMPYESLGLLASARDQSGPALQHLERAIELKSTSFLAHYLYGREKLRSESRGELGYKKMDQKTASIIRGALRRSTEMMPSFGPAHHLLGLVEMIQGENPVQAEQHVRKALALEPENATFSMALARIQIARSNKPGARETLQSLLHPSVEEKTRETARAMLQKLG